MKERPTVGAALESSTQAKVAQTFFPSGEKDKTRKVESEKGIKPESHKTKKVEKEKSRIVESQKGRKVENHYEFSIGKTQVSFWLPDEVVETLKIHAAKERKRMSRIVTEVLTKTLSPL